MLKLRLSLLALAGVLIIASTRLDAGTFQETFATDPAARNWRAFGTASLFHWNSTNQNLEVTWDSAQPNSYFHRPLGTVLTKADDFTLAFDLRLQDVAARADKANAFQLAVGLIHWADATNVAFIRGSGYQAPNLVELDYFPPSVFDATVAPTIISSNNQYASSFNFPLELTPGDLFHVVMSYTANNHTLATTITRNGQPFGPVADALQDSFFDDFRVDQLAISSYSEAGQDPLYAGSIIAHGTVDNFVITTPPPPVANVAGARVNGHWQVQFDGQANWTYTLERTSDWQSWTAVSSTVSSSTAPVTLEHLNPPPDNGFYRVRAERP